MIFQSLYGFRNRNQRRAARREERSTTLHARVSGGRGGAALPPFVKPLLLLGAVLVGAGGIAYGARAAGQRLCARNDRFLVREIVLPAGLSLPRDMILERAGIAVGDNLFKLTPAEIRANLLKVPAIRAAEVSRQLPGRLDINLHVREAAARVGLEKGLSYIIDPEGMVFTRSARHTRLPLIVGVNPVALQFGQSILGEQTRDALEVIRLLSQRKLDDVLPVKIIYVNSPDLLDIRLHSGQQLRLPRDRLEDGLQNLAVAIQKDQELGQRHSVYTVIDKNKLVVE